MTEQPTLELDGKKTLPQACIFEMRLEAENWHGEEEGWLYGPDELDVTYSFEIRVDEHSGEDGAAAPVAQTIPIEPVEGRYLLPPDLPGMTVEDGDDWDAWYGNDAPELEDSRMDILGWRDGALVVDWRAEYGFGERKQFRFTGPLRFDGIRLTVKAEEDADRFFVLMFGEDALSRVVKQVGRWTDYGPSMPEDRRRWLGVTYVMAEEE